MISFSTGPSFRSFFLLMLGLAAYGFSFAMPDQVQLDSLPSIEKAYQYQGYRIELVAPKVIKRSKDWMKISCTIINTGREPVYTGKKSATKDKLIIQFDKSFDDAELLAYEEQIKESILKNDLKLFAGQMRSNTEIKFSTKDILTPKGASPTPAAEEEKPTDTVAILQPLADEAPSPDSDAEAESELPWDPNACADLSLTNLQILKKSKRSITLLYTITNYGAGPADILGDSKVEGDNVAIRANLSSTDKTTRGSLLIGGQYINDKKVSRYNNLLPPNESYSGKLKLDISKMTRFTSYIVLELDIYNQLQECDETNNQLAIKVE